MNTPSDTDIAWAAGLWEGEGNIGTIHKVDARHRLPRMEPRLQLPTTDLDVLQKFQAVWGVGKIVGPYHGRPNEKPYWRWSTHSWDEFVAIRGAMRPWFGERRVATYNFVLSQMPKHFRNPKSFKPCDYAPTPSAAGYLQHRGRG